MMCIQRISDTIFVDKLGISFVFCKSIQKRILIDHGWLYDYKRARKGQTKCYYKTAEAFSLWINFEHGYCGIEFCPGKVLYGENNFFIDKEDCDYALLRAKSVFEEELLSLSPNMDRFEDGGINRLDLAVNLILKKRQYQPDALAEVRRLIALNPYSRETLCVFDTGVTSYQKSNSTVVYLKEAEMAQRNSETQFYDRYLRFEVQFRSLYMRGKFKRKNRKINNLPKVVNILSEKLVKKFKDLGFSSVYKSRNQVQKTIIALKKFRPDKTERLLEFLELLNQPAVNSINGNLAKEVYSGKLYRRYFNDIISLGLWPFWSGMIAGDALQAIKNFPMDMGQKKIELTDFSVLCIYICYNGPTEDLQFTHVNITHAENCSIKSFGTSGTPP